MKRTLVLLVILAAVMLGFVSMAYANVVPRMRVNIGFSFRAGDQQLPAGEYWIEMRGTDSGNTTGSMLIIRALDGTIQGMVLAKAAGSQENDSSAYLLFRRVGDSYFLSKAHVGSIESHLLKSRSERDLKMALARDWYGSSSEYVKVAASR